MIHSPFNRVEHASWNPNSIWLVTSRHDTTRSTCQARWDERVEPCCSASSTQAKCIGSTRRTCRVMSRRDVTTRGIRAITPSPRKSSSNKELELNTSHGGTFEQPNFFENNSTAKQTFKTASPQRDRATASNTCLWRKTRAARKQAPLHSGTKTSTRSDYYSIRNTRRKATSTNVVNCHVVEQCMVVT